MYGAIIGDIVGSVYEWGRIQTKAFPLMRGTLRRPGIDTLRREL